MAHVMYSVGDSAVIGNIMEDVEDVNPRAYFMEFHAKCIYHALAEFLKRNGFLLVGKIPQMIEQAAYQITE